jgi:hypothetical protein
MTLKTRLAKLEQRRGIPSRPAETITATDEERVEMMAAVYDASARQRCVPPLPRWFRQLPVEEQLRRFGAAIDRGDFWPFEPGDPPADDTEADDGWLYPPGGGLPPEPAEPSRGEADATAQDDAPGGWCDDAPPPYGATADGASPWF